MNQKKQARVFHADLYGKREAKYDFLNREKLSTIQWQEPGCPEPYCFFVPKDFSIKTLYDSHFSIIALLPEYGSGTKTERDRVCVQFNKDEAVNVVKEFNEGNESHLKDKFDLDEDSRDWKIKSAIEDIRTNINKNLFTEYYYRPFDIRWVFYTGNSRGFIGTPGQKRAFHLIGKPNVSIVICRQQSTFDFQHEYVQITVSKLNQ